MRLVGLLSVVLVLIGCYSYDGRQSRQRQVDEARRQRIRIGQAKAPPQTVRIRAADDFACDLRQTTCRTVIWGTFSCRGCGQSATYVCAAQGRCRREGPAAHLSPSAAAGGQQGGEALARDEGLAVLGSIEPEVGECLARVRPAVKTSVRIQINGDGSVIYLGTEPEQPAKVTSCLRGVFGTLRFRATKQDPITTVTPPFAPAGPSETPQTLESDSHASLVKAPFGKLIPALQACYIEQGAPQKQAALTVEFATNGSASVGGVEPTPSAQVALCLAEVIDGATFPPPADGKIHTLRPRFTIPTKGE